MGNDDELKEVYFDLYCKTCKYENEDEGGKHCNPCLYEPCNTYSHKPVNWKPKKKGE